MKGIVEGFKSHELQAAWPRIERTSMAINKASRERISERRYFREKWSVHWKLSDVAAGKLRSGLKGCVVVYVCTCECVCLFI